MPIYNTFFRFWLVVTYGDVDDASILWIISVWISCFAFAFDLQRKSLIRVRSAVPNKAGAHNHDSCQERTWASSSSSSSGDSSQPQLRIMNTTTAVSSMQWLLDRHSFHWVFFKTAVLKVVVLRGRRRSPVELWSVKRFVESYSTANHIYGKSISPLCLS